MKVLRIFFFTCQFTAVEAVIFIFFHFILAYFSKDLIFSALIMEGIYPLAFRVFTLQIPFQVFFIFVGLVTSVHKEYSILLGSMAAYAVTITWATSNIFSIWSQMLISQHSVGYGLAIMVSVLSTLGLFKVLIKKPNGPPATLK